MSLYDHTLPPNASQLDMDRIPAHVAIIMDGNGRWAKKRAMQRSAGHFEGVGSVHSITEIASDLGMRHLTLYAFSTENWHRPDAEVEILMNLIGDSIEREMPGMVANNVHLNVFGDRDRIPAEPMAKLQRCMDATAHCTGLNMNLCISYSSRSELARAMRNIARSAAAGEISPDAIDEDFVAANLFTAGVPDPDLLIRTGGEQRISNYLLWQIAYSELYFTPILWPDFSKKDFVDAIIDYQSRERRFGKTSEQVAPKP